MPLHTRLLRLAVALGLVAALFAAAISPTVAASEDAVVGRIYFPWVPHNNTIAGVAGVTGAIVVQNVEPVAVDVVVKTTTGEKLAALTLKPRASQVWTAAQLKIPREYPEEGVSGGAGIIVEARWNDPEEIYQIDHSICVRRDWSVVRVSSRNYDIIQDFQSPIVIAKVAHGGFVFPAGSYSTWWDSNGTLVIDWSPSGPEPAANTAYQVTAYERCRPPRIAGIEKHAVGTLFGPQTTSTTDMVDGYSAVPQSDLELAAEGGETLEGQVRWVVPIVQTSSGWNTEIFITNVSQNDATVNATFYPAAGQGVAGRGTLILGNYWLPAGESVSVDLLADTPLPEGRVGSLWVDANEDVVVAAFRMKPETGMMLTTVAQPRHDEPTNGDACDQCVAYGPLVFRDYNGWNTGINIANLSSFYNRVTVTYYNYDGNVVATESRTIPPRAMEYVYTPATGNVGLGDNQVTAVQIAGDYPLAAAIDEVKYLGGHGQGHAMSYAASGGLPGVVSNGRIPVLDTGRWFYARLLALPLVQKGITDTGTGDTSGINLFNPDPDDNVVAWVQFVDSAGVPVAPTVTGTDGEAPIELPLGPHAGATLYTLRYSEMLDGFIGSAVIGVVGNGALVGVSNNVNYAVAGDGSAAFNLVRADTVYDPRPPR